MCAAKDRKERGRNNGLKKIQERGLCGENNGASKLTVADIIAIRASKDSENKLGIIYSVSGSAIGSIRRRKTWKHI